MTAQSATQVLTVDGQLQGTCSPLGFFISELDIPLNGRFPMTALQIEVCPLQNRTHDHHSPILGPLLPVACFLFPASLLPSQSSQESYYREQKGILLQRRRGEERLGQVIKCLI